jgi:hypothetical protein
MPDDERPQFKVTWLDGRREPTVAPNPQYPDGVDLIMGGDTAPHCKVELPYPAVRCGYYRIECRVCGIRIAVTTAGRPDDPRSATFNCKPKVEPAPPPKPKDMKRPKKTP